MKRPLVWFLTLGLAAVSFASPAALLPSAMACPMAPGMAAAGVPQNCCGAASCDCSMKSPTRSLDTALLTSFSARPDSLAAAISNVPSALSQVTSGDRADDLSTQKPTPKKHLYDLYSDYRL